MTRAKLEKVEKELLIKQYKEAEQREGKVLPSTDLTKYGLHPVSKYTQQFGTWRKFLKSIGKDVESRRYTRKTDYFRFFYPAEYLQFIDVIHEEKHKRQIDYLLKTGMKIGDARIALKNNTELKFPSTQYFDKMMKKYAMKAGINDYQNFSAQTICKTLEVWAISGLGIPKAKVEDYVNRVVRVKDVNFNEEEKKTIHSLIGNIFK